MYYDISENSIHSYILYWYWVYCMKSLVYILYVQYVDYDHIYHTVVCYYIPGSPIIPI